MQSTILAAVGLLAIAQLCAKTQVVGLLRLIQHQKI
jgi:hypothetical protein